MKLPLKEQRTLRYLHINPETNTVHLLMPLMSGTDVGLDNTCKAVYSLQEFFGLMGANKQAHALGELEDYQEALAFDIQYMPDGAEKARKESRLEQVRNYIAIIKSVQIDERIKKPLTQTFPRYPKPLETLMGSDESNLYSIILRPSEQDIQLRTTAIKPVFSLPHDTYNELGNRVVRESLAYETLALSYKAFVFKSKSQEQLIARVLTRLGDAPVDFEQTKIILSAEIDTYLGLAGVLFDTTQGSEHVASVAATKAYIDEQMGFDESNPATHEGYIKALLGYCTPTLFDATARSPFDTIDTPTQAGKEETLSLLTQFFLAELNSIYRAQGLTEANFGQILEGDTALTHALAEEVKKALTEERSVEEALIGYLQSHLSPFHISSPLSPEASALVMTRFKAHYHTIQASPHFDEFLFLSDKPGHFVTRGGFIVTHFAQFLQAGFLDKLDDAAKAFLEQLQQDFATVPKPQNTLSHRNEGLSEVDLDLSAMSKEALQALYEAINTYQDPEVKAACLRQFTRERPDFKPQIDTKAFLQHVAYGEQNEAEALLQKDPELAQELLRAHNIPFTDYSGRTFKCTAYEYAYWAKDSYMQRMLEKYIRRDEDTRLLILSRVLDIEKPESPSAAATFFTSPSPSLEKNKGLDYTTTNEHGEIIHHNDTHFNLKPLKDALQHYITAYDASPKVTEADWEVLDAIWVKEVGGAQRQVPAHVAQEYCHPDRSFYDVTQNKALLDASNPANLKRQLRFFNWETGTRDLWFTPHSHASNPALGFSIGVTGGGGLSGGVGRRGAGGEVDLAALKAIDEVRTGELNKSLDNLSRPLIAPASPAHGI